MAGRCTTGSMAVVMRAIERFPCVIRQERVKQRTRNLHSDQSFKGTWGSPKRQKTHGDGVSIVLKRSGQCPVHGEGTQGMAGSQSWMVQKSRDDKPHLWRAVCIERCMHGSERSS